jgi:A/G-specific adenine glycosylase
MRRVTTAAIRRALLDWYDREARVLPWRGGRDPYAIWVSEIMLQQTRVDTVLGYYGRFLERFPTPATLAGASEDEVLSAWSGLGYYRRARLLHQGVREVVARYGGEVPRDAEARRGLPGVGRYTAGAIGSIAFGLEEPLVDGNVARVLSRVYGIATPPGRADTERALWAHAEALVPGPRPGDLNQSLMELGATHCSRHTPTCARCPLRKHCVAAREGRTEELPPSRARKPPRPVALGALFAFGGRGARAQLWLVRGQGTRFGGLWNLPWVESHDPGALVELLASHGLRGTLAREPIGELEHVLSHQRLHVRLWRVSGVRGTAQAGLRPFALDALGEVGTSSLTRKLLKLGSVAPIAPKPRSK